MLVSQAGLGVPVLVFGLEHLGKDVLELAVVGLQNRVLGGQVHRVMTHQAVVEAGASETADRIVDVVLHLGHAAVFAVVVDHVLNRLGAGRLPEP